jgi:CubicO group peptidase (beta-lactamase class C family)
MTDDMNYSASDITTSELKDNLQKNIPALMEVHNLPGLSLTVIRQAEVVWNQTFGVRSSASQEPVTQDTVFEVASLSKPVFAYAALKLCESKHLALDTPLSSYLPEPYLPDEPRALQITMRHVLSHTPGFPNWRPEGKPLKMLFSPGERFSYSGEGYMYLQKVVEHLTGQEPATYLWSKLLKPLDMLNSCFTWTAKDGLETALGHNRKGQAPEKREWPKMSAASSLHSTPADFGNFMCAVMRPVSDHPAHLGREMTDVMLTMQVPVSDPTPEKNDPNSLMRNIKSNIKLGQSNGFASTESVGWGLGWGIQRTSTGDSIWHWGDNGNFRAFAVGYPEDGSGIVIMTNGKNGQKVINSILHEIVGGEYPGLDWLNGLKRK